MSLDRGTADAWVGGERRWDAYFAVVLVGTLVLAQVTGQGTARARLLTTSALLAMALWYLAVGRQAMYDAPAPAWRGPLYLAGLVPLLIIVEIYTATDTFILLALCPQCFMAASYRQAVPAVVTLNLTPVGVAVALNYGSTAVATALGIAALGIAFSIAFGTWIIKIIDQSYDRAQLIAQLEQTRAELARVSREAGMLAERERLASEIHDTIAQGFTSIVMLVQAADSLLDADPAQASRQLDLIGRTARENLAEARALVAGLAPAALGTATLPDALARLTDGLGQELGVETSFTLHGNPRPLPTGTEVVLLRVGQEALSNVRKHARADSVQVTLSLRPDHARLDVRDNGTGFDAALVGEGYGLRGMRARVADAGGDLKVVSAPGQGTTVSAEVP